MQQNRFPTRTIIRTVISLTLAGAALALGIAGLPSRVETHGGDPGFIHACAKNENGQLRLVGPTDTCRPSETAVDWSITGPQGPAGPAGPTGATGPAGPQGNPGTDGLNASEEPCNPDAVKVGTTCVDKYEASVWQTTDPTVIAKLKDGTVTLADLAAATQISPSSSCSPAFPGGFPATGNWTATLFAVSIPGVRPTACTSWFQAEQACAFSGKRLLTNQEWQRAAAGTPDPGTDNGTTNCNISATHGPVNTGSRSACLSNAGAFDMVGNVWEWTADWGSRAAACTTWPAGFSLDVSCIGGDAVGAATLPGAVMRGGNWDIGAWAGVFALRGDVAPSVQAYDFGFRCAR